ncbi:MAG: radical SAM protein [Syntrophobacteraceae bacterium]|nr:radical SAM protein [Syntrophobacteraceae bacterium]
MTDIVEYVPLVRELHERAAKLRAPINGAFELTAFCNLRCGMCYVRQSGGGNGPVGKKELSASEWLDLARQAKESGLLFLLLTGGEVFLRKDYFEIYEPLTRMGFMLTVFTNGALITAAIARRLSRSPPSRIEISLYGATAASYEKVTGVVGSFAACCAGIENLIANRVPLVLKSTLSRFNVSELEDMRQMAHDWGVQFYASWLLSRRPDKERSQVEDYRLSARECVELEARDRASASELREAALSAKASDSDSNFYCKAGRAAFIVNPYGELNVCSLLPEPAARPLETGFRNAWMEVVKYVDSAPALSAECSGCGERVFCGRCPAWSLMENGTLTAPVPYWCEIARARKERYGGPLDPAPHSTAE